MKEIWKDIPSYEGKYQASNLGEVRSINYKLVGKKLILSKRVNPHGYYVVRLCVKGKKRKIHIHKLVAMAFLNHKPCGFSIIINHIDENKLNNNLENLELTSVRANSSLVRDHYTSKFIGVCLNKKARKWQAQIRIKGKRNFLGYFDSEIEASEAYQKRLKEHLNE